MDVGALEHTAPLVVDHQALAIEDVVVLQDVLADLEVLRLDGGLRRADGVAHHLGLDRLVVRHIEATEEGIDHVGLEQAHEVVFKRKVEARLTRVTLTARAAAQLVVDAAGLVPLRAKHVETAELDDLVMLAGHRRLRLRQGLGPRLLVGLGILDGIQAAALEFLSGPELRVAPEHDVGAATGHVGRDRHRALAAGLGDDRGLTLVVLGIEHLMAYATLLELVRDQLALLHARGADEHRLP